MSYSTETLVKLRGLTGQGRSRANVTVPTVQRRYRNKHSYNVRANKVTVLNNTNFAGNYSFQVPAFNSLVGEMWLEVDLPALTPPATYRKYAPLHLIDEVRLNAGQRFYSYKPREVFPILLSRCRDRFQKQQLRAIFGGTASSAGGKFILPILTPWSVWQGEGIMDAPDFGERRGGIWDASKLANNLVVELQFATRADGTSDGASAFATASDLGNCVLYWEELVCSKATRDAIRAEIPDSYCVEEYTRQNGVTVSDSAATTIKCAALVSRAATTGFIFRCRTAAEDDTDLNCMAGDEELETLKVTVDGRDVYDTDGRSEQMRDYQNILAGRDSDTAVAEPKFAHWTFGNTHKQYNSAHIPGLLKNGAVNELDIDVQSATGSGSTRCDVVAVHLRHFKFSDGTVKVANAY